MARRLVVQKNGLFALYSTIVDNLIGFDLTAEELIQNAREEAANKAEDEMRLWLQKPRPGRAHFLPAAVLEWGRYALTEQEKEDIPLLLEGDDGPQRTDAIARWDWRALVDRAGVDFNPQEWTWCVDLNSVPDGKGGLMQRACVYVMGDGGEQLQYQFALSSATPEGLEYCRERIRQDFGIQDILTGVG